MSDAYEVQTVLKRALNRLTIATIVLYVMLLGAGVIGIQTLNSRDAKLDQVATQTHEALCTFVDDLERRVETSVQFLEDNPDGIPGLPAAVIQQGIDNQRQTLLSLSGLGCA